MPPPYKRAERVADLLQRELSRLLQRESKDPRLHDVTITGVRLSPDLRHARVLFTGAPGRAEEHLAGLKSATGFLRGHLGRELHLRYAPDLTFELDESVEKTLEVLRLLKQVHPDADA